MQGKLILFAVNSSLILISQYFILKHVKSSFESNQIKKSLKVKVFYMVFIASLGLLAALIGTVIFQMFYYGYYYTSTSIYIIVLSYGIAAALIIYLSLSFFSWYRSNHSSQSLESFHSLAHILIQRSYYTVLHVCVRSWREISWHTKNPVSLRNRKNYQMLNQAKEEFLKLHMAFLHVCIAKLNSIFYTRTRTRS
jgi:hypothetical protein